MRLSQQGKRNLLRLLMFCLLIGMWIFFGSRDEEVVWWFWLVPLPVVYGFYRWALHITRCPSCGEEFAYRIDQDTSLVERFLWSSGSIRMKCRFCGQVEYFSGAGGGGGGGGGGP